MRRHQGETDENVVFRHGSGDDGSDEDAILEQTGAEPEGLLRIPDEQRDDRRLAVTRVEAWKSRIIVRSPKRCSVSLQSLIKPPLGVLFPPFISDEFATTL